VAAQFVLAKFGAPNLSAPNFGVTNFGASNFGASPMIAAPFGVLSPVSESEPRPAPVKLAITGVVPVDKFFRLLVVETPAPASMIGERRARERRIESERQGKSQQRKTPCFQFEQRVLLV